MPETYTFSELAQILPLSRSTITAMARKGELPAEREGRRVYIRRAAVEAFLQKCILSLRPRHEEPELEIEEEAEGVVDVRHRVRLIPNVVISARFLTAPARVLDIGEHGLRIHHGRALRIGSEGRLSFEIEGLQRIWVVRARIEWSRLSSDGYISGVSITENHEALTEAVACLERLNAVEPDRTSMARKREAQERKGAQREAMRRAPQPELVQAEEQAALIRATMEQLRRDPVAAQRWYSRARYAKASETVRRLLPPHVRERDEVLAIWEALNRRVDLRAVSRIVASSSSRA